MEAEGHQTLHFDVASAVSVLERFPSGGVPIDEDHGLVDSERLRGVVRPTTRHGTVTRLRLSSESGEDYLFGAVSWFPSGVAAIMSGRLSHLSPCYLADAGGHVYALHSLALTNRPAATFHRSYRLSDFM